MSVSLAAILNRLRGTATGSDADLLDRYARTRDEAAFATLVERHGPMVLAVCRRTLGDPHAAEDAFQATFLVLARRAGGIGRPDRIAGWLYGVALRVARESRRSRLSQPRLETAPTPLDRQPDAPTELSARELLAILEDELSRLPRAYRMAVVLCCLEGLSQEEAATRLGWSSGQVKGQLERGRKRLHDRLARRGIALSAVFGIAQVVSGAGPMQPALATSCVRLVSDFTSGRVSAATSSIAALAEGVLRSMKIFQIGMVVAGLFLAATIAATLWAQPPGQMPQPGSVGSPRPDDEGSPEAAPPRADDRKAAEIGRAVQAVDRYLEFRLPANPTDADRAKADELREAAVKAGQTEGMRPWVNGRLVYERNSINSTLAERKFEADADDVTELRARVEFLNRLIREIDAPR